MNAPAGRFHRDCPSCGSPKTTGESFARYADPEWPMVRCAECDLIYLEWAPVFDRLVEELAWTDQHERYWEKRLQEQPILARLDKWTLWRLGLFGDPSPAGGLKAWAKPGPVLDVGCSTGKAFAADKLPPQYIPYGIEIEKSAADYANANFEKRGGKVINADGVTGLKQLPDDFFTGVSCWGYLEHEAQPRESLIEIHRVLKKDGIVLIKVPNYACWNRSVMGAKWTGFWHPDHVQYYTPKTIGRMAEACGFDAKFRLYGRIPLNDYMYVILKPR
jgi:SAM-dependent methyltransferase